MVVSSYTHSANYDYKSPVTLSNPIHSVGKNLDSGQPAYFFSVSPTIDFIFTYTLDSTGPVNVNVDYDAFVIASSTGDVDGEEKVFWKKTYPVSVDPLKSGKEGKYSYSSSLNVLDIQSNIQNIQDELGYPSDASVEVVTYVRYDGKANGINVKGVEEFNMPIVISSAYYQIPGDLEFSNTIDTYEIMNVKNSSLSSVMVGPVLLFILSIGLITLFGLVRKQGEVPLSHIRKLEAEAEHARFKDFISKGTFPAETGSLMEVTVSSLQDLIDAALDMDARVIHDSQKNVYFMIHSGILYSFNVSHGVYGIGDDAE